MKNLLISVVDRKNCSNLWKYGSYDTVLIDSTQDRTLVTKDKVTYLGKKGDKTELIKWFLRGTDYDNIIIIDDDVSVSSQEIEVLFHLTNEFGIVHPVMNKKNYDNPKLMRDYMAKYRFANNCETFCIGLNRDNLNKVLDIFESPDKWHEITKTPFALIDGIEILKNNPVKSEIKNIEVLFHTQRNNISFVTIYGEDRKKELTAMLESLPPDSEIILVKTIKSDKTGLSGYKKEGNVITADWYYEKFNYAHARNAAKSLATRPVIFNLDSDERLNPLQHRIILEECLRLELNNYYALHTRTISPTVGDMNNNLPVISANGRLNIFRNDKRLYYEGAIHELIDFTLYKHNLEFKDTEIIIYHTGYNLDLESKINKSKFRIETALNYSSDFLESNYGGFFHRMLKKEFEIYNNITR